jgi:sulfate adenylyltransferase (ADP) / ATP adenylyltransferase
MNLAESSATDWLVPGTLWPKVRARHDLALELGALKPFATTHDWIEDGEVRFLVRILVNIKRKENAKKQQPKDFNPFLPYEKDLFVTDLSPSHLVLLNKFNVMDYHILIVTRAFESQESLLTVADFEALALTLSEVNGLAFYNGGKTAGASQPHKHLQLVPLPLVPDGAPQVPMETALLNHKSSLPYRNAVASLQDLDFKQPLVIAKSLMEIYRQLMVQLALWPDISQSNQPLAAYNLLATRQWMCIVPRSQESFAGISINSLGFAGALLVKNPERLETLRGLGAMNVLTQVGYPA